MGILTVNVTIDIGNLIRVNRYSDRNRPVILKTASNRYLKFVRGRYILAASGNGSWPDLKPETVQKKTQRGIATNPDWILREGDAILNSLGIRTRGKLTYVGFVRNQSHPRSKLSINQLVNIHTRGLGRMPVRRVIQLPSNDVRRQMTNDIRVEYNKKIRQEKRK